jgi:hypothetical protein
MSRIVRGLRVILATLVFSAVFSGVLFKYSDRNRTQVLYSELVSWQITADMAAIEKKVAAKQDVSLESNDDGPTRVECISRPCFWDYPLLIFGPVFLLAIVSFLLSLSVIKRSPLSKNKKKSWAAVLLLAVLLVYLVFYGYAAVREKVLLSRFSLTPEDTVVVLECSSSGWGTRGPDKVLYCSPSDRNFWSFTNNLFRSPYSFGRSDRLLASDYDVCNLSKDEMTAVIDLLKSRHFFSMGAYAGYWGTIDGTFFNITVSERDHATSVRCYCLGENVEPILKLFEDVSNVRPWDGAPHFQSQEAYTKWAMMKLREFEPYSVPFIPVKKQADGRYLFVERDEGVVRVGEDGWVYLLMHSLYAYGKDVGDEIYAIDHAGRMYRSRCGNLCSHQGLYASSANGYESVEDFLKSSLQSEHPDDFLEWKQIDE